MFIVPAEEELQQWRSFEAVRGKETGTRRSVVARRWELINQLCRAIESGIRAMKKQVSGNSRNVDLANRFFPPPGCLVGIRVMVGLDDEFYTLRNCHL